jgi:hypothetical protein
MNPAPVTEIPGSDVIEPVEMADSGEIDDCTSFSAFIDFAARTVHWSELITKSLNQLIYPDHHGSHRRISWYACRSCVRASAAQSWDGV